MTVPEGLVVTDEDIAADQCDSMGLIQRINELRLAHLMHREDIALAKAIRGGGVTP